ncbi:hypothetical protein CEUSTIGMA_g13099.t1 [Chlamydomonas eustigma]|uniref:Helicase ATP-binding domain-containing protein n=1 Tax=Chlamydomonas eustigma TaxID=1157962 RepID=A0A250XRK2_9CHLO|nr:hypothetical protein CEUSTIGMA_g13099.t1 [Chlamydomonas eustigma]|eukprot:GAX85684.1 hypothetical protein CEUSTIGMA_g13099.t1 [Chlamydomonas eustigma]
METVQRVLSFGKRSSNCQSNGSTQSRITGELRFLTEQEAQKAAETAAVVEGDRRKRRRIADRRRADPTSPALPTDLPQMQRTSPAVREFFEGFAQQERAFYADPLHHGLVVNNMVVDFKASVAGQREATVEIHQLAADIASPEAIAYNDRTVKRQPSISDVLFKDGVQMTLVRGSADDDATTDEDVLDNSIAFKVFPNCAVHIAGPKSVKQSMGLCEYVRGLLEVVKGLAVTVEKPRFDLVNASFHLGRTVHQAYLFETLLPQNPRVIRNTIRFNFEGAGAHFAMQNRGDYVPYPDVSDPHLERTLFLKEELWLHRPIDDDSHNSPCNTGDAKGDANGDANGDAKGDANGLPFELSDVQMVVRNLLSPGTALNGLLVFHGVGVGKTCTAVSVAELFADSTASSFTSRGQPSVLVVTRPGLRENFRKTVFDVDKVPRSGDRLDFDAPPRQCTGYAYTDRVSADVPDGDADQVDYRVQRLIRSRYEFLGLGELATQVESLTEGAAEPIAAARLRARFSNKLVIVDEAHNLRLEDDSTKRVTPALTALLAAADNVKLLLLTATPMFNRAQDVLDLLNLLLVNDRRPVVSAGDIFAPDGSLKDEASAGRLRRLLRGYVSFMPGDDPAAFPTRLSPLFNSDSDRLREPPSVDVHGRTIPRADRLVRPLSDYVIVSRASASQDAALAGMSAPRQGHADEGRDEDPEVNAFRSSLAFRGMQVGNVRYDGGRRFDSAFRRVRAKPLQFEYASSKYFAPDQVSLYAPKVGAIASRVAACKGVALIYSRYIFDGILPIAFALEHLGFRPFGLPNMLRDAEKGEGDGARHDAPRYTLITAGKDLAQDDELVSRAYAALTSDANSEGRLVKAVIVSDSGSEGIDLRFVREVHVLEPWYHLNKIDQIVGRASRFCSHARLVPRDRNVTVYLHAIAHRDDPRVETVDLWALRIAQRKQVNIERVERILQESSIDCVFNARRVAKWARAAAAAQPVLRSGQGVVAKLPQSQRAVGRGHRAVVCDVPLSLPASNVDRSTFDPRIHGAGAATYRHLISQYFRRTSHAAGTAAQIWDFVKSEVRGKNPRLGDDEREQVFLHTLRGLAEQRIAVVGPRGGRKGFLLRKGERRYVFQPLDEDTTVLSDWDRGAPRAQTLSTAVDAVSMFRPSGAWSSPLSSSSALPANAANASSNDKKLDRLAATLAALSADARQLLLLLGPAVDASLYAHVVVDSCVDALDERALLLLCVVCAMNRKAAAFVPARLHAFRADVARSLVDGGYLSSDLEVARMPSGDAYAIDRSTGAVSKRQAHTMPQLPPAAANDVDGVMAFLPGSRRATFKILTQADGKVQASGRGSGFVCHQSSVFESDKIREKILQVDPAVSSIQSLSKGDLCRVYELVLRGKGRVLRPMRSP